MKLNTIIKILKDKGFEIYHNSWNEKLFKAKKDNKVINFEAIDDLETNPEVMSISIECKDIRKALELLKE